jgi:hypothetical protein
MGKRKRGREENRFTISFPSFNWDKQKGIKVKFEFEGFQKKKTIF